MKDPAERIRAGARLNMTANDLFGAYIVHMNLEETDLVPRMQEHFTDPQMLAMQGQIIGGMPPDRLFAILRWMAPALNVTELTHLLLAVKPGAPPPVFQKFTELCEARVRPDIWTETTTRIGL